MIPKRIALLFAPWCLVWVIAIGCSRQEPDPSAEGGGKGATEKLTSLKPAEREEPALDMEGRYAEIAKVHADPIELRNELARFYTDWGKRDGEAAVTHAMAQDRTLVRHAFEGWLQTDSDEPTKWVLAQSDSQRRQSVLAVGLLHALPPDDHQAKAEWVGNFAAQSSGARLVSEVAIGWGKDSPREALEWLSQLPDCSARSGGIQTLFQRWTDMDPEKASTHLTAMQEGAEKDLAISSLAKAIHADDPEAAQLWAETIADKGLRERTSGLLNKLASAGAPPLPDL